MRRVDWSATPLGPTARWPHSLRTAVDIMLNSRYAMFVWWGPQRINLYNDAYRPFLGKKHPAALGRPAQETWAEIWDHVGPRADAVFDHGEATFDEALMLPMDRHGYWEETYFTFSYSPIHDDRGEIGGLFCAVSEETLRIIGDRRLKLLREVAASGSETHSAADVCRAAARCIAGEQRDLPFALLYLNAEDGHTTHLAAAAGIAPGHQAAPAVIALDQVQESWPLHHARSGMMVVEDLAERFADLPCGGWEISPGSAVVTPLPAREGPGGFLVAGLNPYRLFDEEYRGFIGLLAGQIASGIGNARAYEAERRRAEALAEVDRAKTAFFSNVSHEFRTPLTLMLGPLEDVLNDRQPDALQDHQRERLETAHRNSLRLLKLVNTLLDFSRIEAGRLQAQYAPTDLAALTADLASGFRSAIERAGLSLTTDLRTLPEAVFVDRDMWEKVVLNLLSNALKFTFEGGITVTLRAEGGEAVLAVQDTGVGIPPDQLSRVFERFHRIQGQRSRSFEGSGIGLALVHELVRLHGGRIDAQSAPGTGTVFTVRMPFGTAHLDPDHIAAAPAGTANSGRLVAYVEEALRWLPDAPPIGVELEPELFANPRGSAGAVRQTILLADDNTDMRDYVRRLLAPRYDVVAVPDGAAAVAALRRQRPDLVLSDVMMPEVDGFGLLAVIRNDPALRDLPVILLSARAGEEARVEGLGAGADDYLTKPFAARELLARIGANLALAQVRREATLAALDSAERLREMFEQAPGFMCMLRGPEHVFELANAAYLRLVGNREIVGRRLRDALPEIKGQGYFELLDDVFRTGRAFAGNALRVNLQRAPGEPASERYVDLVYQPIRDRSGAVTGIFVEGADVTERVHAEQALRETNERLEARVAERTAELSEAVQQLQIEIEGREQAQEALRQAQKMEAIGQLTGGVAHDFNNLLTAIMGGAETLRRHLPPELGAGEHRIRRALAMIEHGADRAAMLTQRLLAFGRRQALAPQAVDVNRLIEGMSDLLRRTLGEALTVDTVLTGGIWPVMADPNQLESALLNLAVNARDAMQKGGRLTMRTAKVRLEESDSERFQDLVPGDYVSVAVSDTGCGMSKATLERAFEPFFTTKPIGQGTGLGLSQVYGFIRQSNGQIEIHSAPGRGTTVTLHLPRLLERAAERLIEPAADEVMQAGAGELLLVVEDDQAVRSHSTETLRELGYQVVAARDGATALQLLAHDAGIRLLFTDIGLPGGMTGRELADRARQDRPDLPVLFTTGYAGDIMAQIQPMDLGTGLLPKPFTRAALASKLRTLLEGVSPAV